MHNLYQNAPKSRINLVCILTKICRSFPISTLHEKLSGFSNVLDNSAGK